MSEWRTKPAAVELRRWVEAQLRAIEEGDLAKARGPLQNFLLYRHSQDFSEIPMRVMNLLTLRVEIAAIAMNTPVMPDTAIEALRRAMAELGTSPDNA